jgi:hypothetical protein
MSATARVIIVREDWQSRPRTLTKYPFAYNWSHATTGNKGSGVIFMPSYKMLQEWIARWNHSNFANGWVYSLP